MPKKPIDPGILLSDLEFERDLYRGFYLVLCAVCPGLVIDLKTAVLPKYVEFFNKTWPVVEGQGWPSAQLGTAVMNTIHTEEHLTLRWLIEKWAHRWDIHALGDDWEVNGAAVPRGESRSPDMPYWLCRLALNNLYGWVKRPERAEADPPVVALPLMEVQDNPLTDEELTLPPTLTEARWDFRNEPWLAFREDAERQLAEYQERITRLAVERGYSKTDLWGVALRQRLNRNGEIPIGHNAPIDEADPLWQFYIVVLYRYASPRRTWPELKKQFALSDETLKLIVDSFLKRLNLTNREPDSAGRPRKRSDAEIGKS